MHFRQREPTQKSLTHCRLVRVEKMERMKRVGRQKERAKRLMLPVHHPLPLNAALSAAPSASASEAGEVGPKEDGIAREEAHASGTEHVKKQTRNHDINTQLITSVVADAPPEESVNNANNNSKHEKDHRISDENVGENDE